MKLRDFLAICSDPYEIEYIRIYSPKGEFLGGALYHSAEDEEDESMHTVNRFGEAIVKKYDVEDKILTCITESLR